jgi:histidinol phosphatase-like PHP family hydrolase
MNRSLTLNLCVLGVIYLSFSSVRFCRAEQTLEKSENTLTKSKTVLYHVHVTGNFDVDDAVELSKKLGVKFGVVDNFGRHYWNYSDEHVKKYLKRLEGKAVYKGIQAEGRDWMRVFSKELLSKLDFILADGMTFPNTNGTYSRLWRNDEVRINDVQFFMDRYTDYLVDIIEEPIDIIANLTYLPEIIRDDYEKLWTEQRMQKIIDAAVKNNVAIEINARYRIPSPTFLKRAKECSARFAFGANSHNARDAGNMDYCFEMAKFLNLSDKDMFVPAQKKKITTYK